MTIMTRRGLLAGIAASSAICTLPAKTTASTPLPEVVAFRQPGCGCCEVWVERMKAAGFSATMTDDAALDDRRSGMGVPADLAGCHLALIGGYVFEGHVPPADIIAFLASKPDALGLSVPGMPAGSPGMETSGASKSYDVVLMGRDGSRSVFARY